MSKCRHKIYSLRARRKLNWETAKCNQLSKPQLKKAWTRILKRIRLTRAGSWKKYFSLPKPASLLKLPKMQLFVKAPSKVEHYPVNLPTARNGTRHSQNCLSLRVIQPADQLNKAATANFRRFCLCAEKFSIPSAPDLI